jgi:hypothetical protein
MAYFSTLKMEATCSSDTSLNFQRIKQRYVSEDKTLHNSKVFEKPLLILIIYKYMPWYVPHVREDLHFNFKM